jgi:threonine/homoserine/homoserine lactone efflux protein
VIFKDISTAIILGLIGGLTPGPVIILALSEILRSPTKGISNGTMYIAVAGLTEFCIGFFLVATSSWLKIPPFIFHMLAVVGAFLLFYIAFQLYKIKHFQYEQENKKVGVKHIIMLMILNGPMWLFWISVCLPIAFSLGNQIHYGQYLFIAIFEVSMVTALAAIFFSFRLLRKYLSNEKIVGKVFIILSVLIFLIGLRLLYSEVSLLL